ncbi:zona pellucida sperm-binding protein 3-like [Cheilinus undulatus]|uniref:zona pellucida sperm-binding protein 3-like n=1 Tax=Cheilinus undulatus TaxID=241271 RepID=UPI001BD3E0B7|nr:zona pellucida sperm-binding protein 3-like [Cheilinus undulatus]
MQSMQLFVVGLVLTCLRLSDARFLSVRGPMYPQVEDQKPAGVEAESAAKPERGNSRESAQHTAEVLQRRTWPELNPFSWKFPNDPVEPEHKAPVKFEPQQQKKERVAVRCGESKVQVEVSQDLPGLSRNVKPEEMTLGGCSATDVDDLSHVLVFESQLHGCGSKLVMTEDAFIYAFTLVFKPRVLSRGGIIRSQSAIIGVECHYPR